MGLKGSWNWTENDKGAEAVGARSGGLILLCHYKRQEERIVGGIEYATSLFERKTIERYAGYLRNVLAGDGE